MQADEIRELNEKEIQQRLDELERERFNLRMRGATQPVDRPLRFREIRKDVARLKTVLREKQLGLRRETAEGGAPGARAAKKTTSKRAAKTSARTRR